MDYEAIVDDNIDVVYRAALSYCKNRHDAEDIVQTTFEKLLQTDTEFEDKDHIRKWLIRVAVNECKNMYRSFWRRNVSAMEECTFAKEESEIEYVELLEAVMRLPAKYSIVIHLYYYEGYRIHEISELLNITESNVKIRLKRARSRLKEQLGEGEK